MMLPAKAGRSTMAAQRRGGQARTAPSGPARSRRRVVPGPDDVPGVFPLVVLAAGLLSWVLG
jgi:hypothetical protein